MILGDGGRWSPGSGGKSKRPKGRAGVAALQVGSVVITFDPAGESNRVAVKLSYAAKTNI